MLCNTALMARLWNFYSSFKPNFSRIFCSSFKLFENQTVRLSRVYCTRYAGFPVHMTLSRQYSTFPRKNLHITLLFISDMRRAERENHYADVTNKVWCYIRKYTIRIIFSEYITLSQTRHQWFHVICGVEEVLGWYQHDLLSNTCVR
jgi:hypothetical protein